MSEEKPIEEKAIEKKSEEKSEEKRRGTPSDSSSITCKKLKPTQYSQTVSAH